MDRRLRRHAQARPSSDPGPRALLEDALFRGPRAAARPRLRSVPALRGRPEQASEDGDGVQDPHRLHPGGAGRPDRRAEGRPGRRGDRQPDHHSGAAPGGRLHESDQGRRLRDRRHRPGAAVASRPPGPLRPRDLHPQGFLLLRERREAQRGAEKGGEGPREDSHRAGQPRSRRHPGDGQRGPGPGDGGRRQPRAILEAGLHQNRAPAAGRAPDGRADRPGDPQEQPAPEEGARRLPRALPRGLRHAESRFWPSI